MIKRNISPPTSAPSNAAGFYTCTASLDPALGRTHALLQALFADGIMEVTNAEGEKFEESRLIGTLRAHHNLPVDRLQETTVAATRRFGTGKQADDIMLAVARYTA